MTRLRTVFATIATLCAVAILAQATSEEEYNYLTKGYAIQISSGLDMKKGYTMKDMGRWPVNFEGGIERAATFKGLFRDGSSAPCALLMIYKRMDNSTTEYFCIPTLDADKELWDRTLQQVSTAANAMGSGGMDTAIIYGLMHFGMQEVSK